jgi:hypothetical protein
MSILKQRAVLGDEGGPIIAAIPQRLSWGIDDGWEVSVAFNRDYDLRHAKDKPYTLTIYDDANAALVTPVMVAGPRGRRDPRSVSGGGMANWSGWDRTSQRMRLGNQSFPTFVGTNSVALVETLATKAGVTISGVPNWYVHEEDVKQAKLSNFLLDRLLKLAAYDLIAELDGTLACVPWENTGGELVMPWANLEENFDPWQVRSGLRVGKYSSIPSAGEADNTYDWYEAGPDEVTLNTPVYGPTATDSGLVTALGFAAFKTDEDEVVAFYSFKPGSYSYSGPFNVAGLATRLAVMIDPITSVSGLQTSNFPAPARILVGGTPPGLAPEGVDREFLNPLPTSGGPDTSLGDQPASEEYIDSLWPSEAVAVARRPHCLAKLNGPADSLVLTRDILDTRPRLKMGYTHEGRLYQVVSIDWDLTGYRTACTLWRV